MKLAGCFAFFFLILTTMAYGAGLDFSISTEPATAGSVAQIKIATTTVVGVGSGSLFLRFGTDAVPRPSSVYLLSPDPDATAVAIYSPAWIEIRFTVPSGRLSYGPERPFLLLDFPIGKSISAPVTIASPSRFLDPKGNLYSWTCQPGAILPAEVGISSLEPSFGLTSKVLILGRFPELPINVDLEGAEIRSVVPVPGGLELQLASAVEMEARRLTIRSGTSPPITCYSTPKTVSASPRTEPNVIPVFPISSQRTARIIRTPTPVRLLVQNLSDSPVSLVNQYVQFDAFEDGDAWVVPPRSYLSILPAVASPPAWNRVTASAPVRILVLYGPSITAAENVNHLESQKPVQEAPGYSTSILFAPRTVAFDWQPGSPIPDAKVVAVFPSPNLDAPLRFESANPAPAWLKLSVRPSEGGSSLKIEVDPGSLPPGKYEAVINVTTTDPAIPPARIPVTLNIIPAGLLFASPASVELNTLPAPFEVLITSPVAGTSFAISSNTPALSWQVDSSVTPAKLTGLLEPLASDSSFVSPAIRISSDSHSVLVPVAVYPPLLPSYGPRLTAVRNAASLLPALSPAAIALVEGGDIGCIPSTDLPGTAIGPQDRIQGISYLVGRANAPILYCLASGALILIPIDAPLGRVEATVSIGSLTSNSLPVSLTESSPGVFTADGMGSGIIAALNQDGRQNSLAWPAQPGKILQTFLAGLGPVDLLRTEGDSRVTVTRLPIRVYVRGIEAEVLYAGPAPTLLPGVYQVNLRVPVNAPPGFQPFQVCAGDSCSQSTATVAIGRTP